MPQSGAVQTPSPEVAVPARGTVDTPQDEIHGTTFTSPYHLRHAQSGKTLRLKRSMSRANLSKVKKSFSFADARAVVKKKSSRLMKGLGAVFGSNRRSSQNSTSTSDGPSDRPASTAQTDIPPRRLSPSSQEVGNAQQSVAYSPDHHRHTSTGPRFLLNARSSSLPPGGSFVPTGRTPRQAPPLKLPLHSCLSDLSRQCSHGSSGTDRHLDQRSDSLLSSRASPLPPLFSRASAGLAPSRSLLSVPARDSQRSNSSRQSSRFSIGSAYSLTWQIEHPAIAPASGPTPPRSRTSAGLALSRLLLPVPVHDDQRPGSSRPSSRFSIPRSSPAPPECTLLEVEWGGSLAPGVACPAQGAVVSDWLHSTASGDLPMSIPPSAASSTSRYGTPIGGDSPPSVSRSPGAPLARRPEPSSEYSCTTDLQPLPKGRSALRAPSVSLLLRIHSLWHVC
jgi:hypothetical protein